MTKEQRERLAHLKREATQAKSALMRILSEVETISASSALKLAKGIERIERWQNT
jgi:hypothetical protein